MARDKHNSLATVTLVLLSILALTACQGDERAARFENYLERLGRTLDVPVQQPVAEAPTVAPRPAELTLPLESGSLDALDFLSISGCAVQVTIGKRNSSLGRLARDSQRLLLELEFLQLAPECIAFQRSKGQQKGLRQGRLLMISDSRSGGDPLD